jgi:hypothetical protein
MQFQIDVSSQSPVAPVAPSAPVAPDRPADLLRQILDLQREQFAQMLQVQREHLDHVRAVAQDNNLRWRNLLTRWHQDIPNLMDHCKRAFPVLEKAYVEMLAAMVEELSEEAQTLENDFALQDFLDRYGGKLGQLGQLMYLAGSLAEAAHQNEAAAAAEQKQREGNNPAS